MPIENSGDQASGGWGLSWCREKWWGSIIAVFTGTNSTVKVSCRVSFCSVCQVYYSGAALGKGDLGGST